MAIENGIGGRSGKGGGIASMVGELVDTFVVEVRYAARRNGGSFAALLPPSAEIN